ncbi:XdhC family protein [Kitasatospora sp. NPDC059673]|uniref:XdhC family protein n=1 Tax=Kitasatospora sp. NPDC059673 TaxID=3346901 RepID=UPI0036C68652
MQDIAAQLHTWHTTGRPFAVATVVRASGSAPRGPGAALAVDAYGEAVGSISGGCVEAAVYEACQEALASGTPVLQHFGYSDEDAFAVGLTCGGSLDVFVHPVVPGSSPGLDAAFPLVLSGTPVAVARIVDGPSALLGATLTVTPSDQYGSLPLAAPMVAETREMLSAGRTGLLRVGSATLFVESYVPPPRLLIFGAMDFATALARIGKFLGYHVTVCDARPVFATRRRFPDADEIVVDWPHRYLDAQAPHLDARTALCVLTHDAKFDLPLLERALRLPVAYIGAMGSRRTHTDRLTHLREAGLTEAELARLHSPIGLDLGARTPEETAISIAAELVAHTRGGTHLPLTTTTGPIHHDPAAGRAPHTGRPTTW